MQPERVPGPWWLVAGPRLPAVICQHTCESSVVKHELAAGPASLSLGCQERVSAKQVASIGRRLALSLHAQSRPSSGSVPFDLASQTEWEAAGKRGPGKSKQPGRTGRVGLGAVCSVHDALRQDEQRIVL